MNVIVPSEKVVAAKVRPLVRIVIVGHVDHGKSTLIGRLLYETGSLPEGKLESLMAVSARRGMPFEWSFLLDALQAERDQGITIDTSQIRFRTPARDFVLIDAPGHLEFLRNMITGAAQADAAILIVDAVEGVREQTRRHGHLLQLLGIRQIAVLINKMDRVDFDIERFNTLNAEIVSYLSELGLAPGAVIPISARNGDNITVKSAKATWYQGPCVTAALDAFDPAHKAPDLPLRLPVQAVYKFDDRRIVAGRVESGRIAIGDEIVVAPSGSIARVKTIETWPNAQGLQTSVTAGQSVGITLDQEIFVERGNVLSQGAAPIRIGRHLRARVFWLHRRQLRLGDVLRVRIGTASSNGIVAAIRNVVDPGQAASGNAANLATNCIGDIDIRLSQTMAADSYQENPATGRLVLELDNRIAGGGLILSVPTDVGVLRRPETETMTQLKAEAARMSRLLEDVSTPERLTHFRGALSGKIVLTTSFGPEDQVITHLLRQLALDIELITLDTGRLFPETYELWAETERRYQLRVRAIYPSQIDVESLVAQQGINAFYESKVQRLACCNVRKVEPLRRALQGAQGWITGLRRSQSSHRETLSFVGATDDGLLKLNPLIDWTLDQIDAFVADNDIPVNPLHAKGFASIGCAPCTRAIGPGEPERAGRWWWEQDDKKECGLHLRPSGGG
jgi:sulfate adenylyltransferase large subunit/thioredoxin-dependent adenylylsulfate APS reductase